MGEFLSHREERSIIGDWPSNAGKCRGRGARIDNVLTARGTHCRREGAGTALMAAPACIIEASLHLHLEHTRQRVTRLVHYAVNDLRAPADQERRDDPPNQHWDQALEQVDLREPPQRSTQDQRHVDHLPSRRVRARLFQRLADQVLHQDLDHEGEQGDQPDREGGLREGGSSHRVGQGCAGLGGARKNRGQRPLVASAPRIGGEGGI